MILLDFNIGVRNGELTGFKPKDIEEGMLFVRRMEITYQGPDGKNIRKIVNRTKSQKGKTKNSIKRRGQRNSRISTKRWRLSVYEKMKTSYNLHDR